jgi:hypothetical protein
LILQLWWWATEGAEAGAEEEAEEEEDTRRLLADLTALSATRYYFDLIRIIPSQVRVSGFLI